MTTIRSRGSLARRIGAVLGVGALCATLLTAVSVVPAAAASVCNPYPDVKSTSSECADIAWLKGNGLAKPAGGKFAPGGVATMATMAEFLFVVANPGKSPARCTSKPFSDVAVTDPACGYFAWAKSAGVMFPGTGGTIRPTARLTRGAAGVYLYRSIYPGKSPARCAKAPFTDVAAKDSACGFISWITSTGIARGLGSGRFGPAILLSRGSLASMVHALTGQGAFLTRFAPPVWAPTGSAVSFAGVTFNRSSSWTLDTSSPQGAVLTSPKDSHGYQCAIYVFRPEGAGGSEASRLNQAKNLVVNLLPGKKVTDEFNGDLTNSAIRGVGGNGWDYTGLVVRIDDGQQYTAISMMARFGLKVVPIFVIQEDSPFGNGWHCVGDDGDFGPEFARVFYSLALGAPTSNATLAAKTVGHWSSTSTSAGNEYVFGKNGHYIHASAGYMGSAQTASGYWSDIFATWAGDGNWAAGGDVVAYRPTGKKAYSEYTRVFDFRTYGGTWVTTRCAIAVGTSGPYSYCTRR